MEICAGGSAGVTKCGYAAKPLSPRCMGNPLLLLAVNPPKVERFHQTLEQRDSYDSFQPGLRYLSYGFSGRDLSVFVSIEQGMNV